MVDFYLVMPLKARHMLLLYFVWRNCWKYHQLSNLFTIKNPTYFIIWTISELCYLQF